MVGRGVPAEPKLTEDGVWLAHSRCTPRPRKVRWPTWVSAAVAWSVCAAALTGAAAADGTLLAQLRSPILLRGNEHIAYRDPLLHWEDGTFHLFFSFVREEEDRLIYWYVGESTSRDLRSWSEPRVLTPRDQNLNFSSPGSLARIGDAWLLTLQTYPIADFRRGDRLRMADARARLFTMRSRDLVKWDSPELIRVKGPGVTEAAMGKMIDPFILRDKDTAGTWWCFFKQDGRVHRARSADLQNWEPDPRPLATGENPCVIVVGGEYVMFYAPGNGVGVQRSSDLQSWREDGPPLTFGQRDWPWAETRLTAGYVADLRSVRGVERFVAVFHGMGPGRTRTDANTNANCCIGIAWSADLKNWDWPGRKP